MLSYAKVINSNFLIVNTYIPKVEFPSFIDSLNTLAEKQLIINYFHVTLTLNPHKRGGIPFKFFKGNTWECNLEDMEPLREIIEEE